MRETPSKRDVIQEGRFLSAKCRSQHHLLLLSRQRTQAVGSSTANCIAFFGYLPCEPGCSPSKRRCFCRTYVQTHSPKCYAVYSHRAPTKRLKSEMRCAFGMTIRRHFTGISTQ